MTKTRPTWILIAIGALTAAHDSHAAAASDEYVLSERCGKRAEEYWREDRKGAAPNVISTYQNHYSLKTNKCYFVMKIVISATDEFTTATMTALDLNDHKRLGGYFVIFGKGKPAKPGMCFVMDKQCESSEEWERLVQPLLDE